MLELGGDVDADHPIGAHYRFSSKGAVGCSGVTKGFAVHLKLSYFGPVGFLDEMDPQKGISFQLS